MAVSSRPYGVREAGVEGGDVVGGRQDQSRLGRVLLLAGFETRAGYAGTGAGAGVET